MTRKRILFFVAALVVICIICAIIAQFVPSTEPEPTTITEVEATATPEPAATPEPEEADTPTAPPTTTFTPTSEPAEPTNTSEPEPAALLPTDTPEPPTPEPEPTDTPEPEPTATPEPEPTDTPEPEPTDTPLPTATLSPEDQIKTIIEDAIGSSNRDVPRIEDVSKLFDVITIKWSINDNLTENMIKTGAKIDVKDMLKALDEAGIVYGLINFEGTFSMRDQLGNVAEETVIWATYEAETVSQINWPQFLHDDMYKIASTSKQHPAFAE